MRILQITFTLLLTVCTLTVASAQVVVAEKPTVPTRFVDRELPPRAGYVVAPNGWAVKDGVYVFAPARYVKERPGQRFVPGKWKKVSGGWTYRVEAWKEK